MKKIIIGGLFLALVGIGLMGCEKERTEPWLTKKVATNSGIENKSYLNKDDLKLIHQEIVNNPQYKNQTIYNNLKQGQLLNLVNINASIVDSIGAQKHLNNCGYKSNFLEMIHEWYSSEESKRYVKLASAYQISEYEANLLFQSIEMIDQMGGQLGIADIGPCADAVISTVVTTVGAIGIGGPLGLGIWLVSKGWSTYQLIKNCT